MFHISSEIMYITFMELKDARHLSPSAQEALRHRAVKAMLDGKSKAEVGRIFGVSQPSLRKWLRLYEKGGVRSLTIHKRGRKSCIQLKPWQAALVVRTIQDKFPNQVKLPFVLWTRKAVRDLLKNRFGIKVSLTTVGRYLKRWNFTPQKPMKRALEQDPVAVKHWLNEEYPLIQKQAKVEKASIHWADEMGVRSDDQVGRSYSRKGQTPVMTRTGKRFGCSMISSISNQGQLRFMVYRERFTAEVFLKFLKRLIKSIPGKVFLIVDNLSVHKAKKVRDWLEENSDQIRIFYLPPYSPELNPDELLNNDVKSNAVRQKSPRNSEEQMSNLRGYLRKIQKIPWKVINYFKAKSVRYAMADGYETI